MKSQPWGQHHWWCSQGAPPGKGGSAPHWTPGGPQWFVSVKKGSEGKLHREQKMHIVIMVHWSLLHKAQSNKKGNDWTDWLRGQLENQKGGKCHVVFFFVSLHPEQQLPFFSAFQQQCYKVLSTWQRIKQKSPTSKGKVHGICVYWLNSYIYTNLPQRQILSRLYGLNNSHKSVFAEHYELVIFLCNALISGWRQWFLIYTWHKSTSMVPVKVFTV